MFYRRKRRQAEDQAYNNLESSYPFMEKINKIGFSRLTEARCQKELFCEMAEMGSNVEANTVQKLFAYAVSLTPNIIADKFGVREVFEVKRKFQKNSFIITQTTFQATLEGRCKKFKCQN